MIRRLLLLLLATASAVAAQDVSVRYQSQVIGSRGLPLSSQNVAVCTQPAVTTTQPCSPLATLATSTTTSSGGTNPLTTDSVGNFFFYAAPGKYTVQVYGPQVSGQFVQPDTVLSCNPSGTCTFTGALTTTGPINLTGAGSAAVQTALNSLVTGQTYLIPCGTYTGPTSIPSNTSLISVCSPDSLDFTNVLVPIVGNPVTMTNQTVFSYTANLTLTNVQNVKMQGIILDFARNNAGLVLTSSSFNHFTDITLRQAGGTSQPALTLNTSAGTNGSFNSVFNIFDHLRITCNTLNTSTYCISAIKMIGAGAVNGAASSFPTQNRFYDTFIGGNVLGFIDAELNSDTNYFWRVSMFEDLATPPAGSYLLGFNLNTPASDQDADGGVYDYVDFTGVGNPTSFIRTGQSNGNYIRITNNTGAIPSVTVLGGTPTYTVQTVGLASTTTYFMQGGALVAAANPTGVPSNLGAGQVMSSQSATSGTYYLGSDTNFGTTRTGQVIQFFNPTGTNSALYQFQGALQATGTQPTLSGTGACATITTQSGGYFAGTFKCTGATAASTLTITFPVGSSNGYVCDVWDETTRANLLQQTSHTAATCVLTATSVTQNDVFVFKALAF